MNRRREKDKERNKDGRIKGREVEEIDSIIVISTARPHAAPDYITAASP